MQRSNRCYTFLEVFYSIFGFLIPYGDFLLLLFKDQNWIGDTPFEPVFYKS